MNDRVRGFHILIAATGLTLLLPLTEGDLFKAQAQEKRLTVGEALALRVAFKAQAFPNDPFNPANKEGGIPPKLLQVRPGRTFRLVITGTPKGNYHTYAMFPGPGMSEGKRPALRYQVPANAPLLPLAPVLESAATSEKVPDETVYIHPKPFTWTQDVLVNPDAKPGIHNLEIPIFLMACDERNCVGPALYPPMKVSVEVVGPLPDIAASMVGWLSTSFDQGPLFAAASLYPERIETSQEGKLSAALAKRLQASNPWPPLTPIGGGAGGGGGPEIVIVPPVVEKSDLGSLLLAAFVGAFLMLLTPCVFPMIPITVNFFLKQSEREHHNALLMACVYSGTIIVLLTLVMLSLGHFVIWMANNAVFNLVMGGVLVVFALSLFGMFELQLPAGLARFTSAREGQGGYIGALFMALTFTITSFTCTGPFLGAMLGGLAAASAGTEIPRIYLVLASLVYATTFAAPFFVLALFPSVLRKLPKSGGWMNVVKVTMAFIELAAALKFLSIADAVLSPGNPRWFNYDTVLCAWIALSVACGLYLMGTYRLPHDDPGEHIGVGRMMFAVFFLGLAIYMTPALFGAKPLGVVGENIVAFLPLKAGGENHLDWESAWAEAKQEKKNIFVDFTGVNCQNCRDNETNVFTDPRVRSLLKNYVVVQLYTDSVPKKGLDPAEAEREAMRNAGFRDAIGNPANPFYFIIEPGDTPLTADGTKLNGRVLDSRNGKIFDVPDFVRFLERRPAKNGMAVAQGK